MLLKISSYAQKFFPCPVLVQKICFYRKQILSHVVKISIIEKFTLCENFFEIKFCATRQFLFFQKIKNITHSKKYFFIKILAFQSFCKIVHIGELLFLMCNICETFFDVPYFCRNILHTNYVHTKNFRVHEFVVHNFCAQIYKSVHTDISCAQKIIFFVYTEKVCAQI